MSQNELISPEWKALNEQLHQERSDFGAGGWRWANAVHQLASEYGCFSILDYGCGKDTLAQMLPLDIRSYDPAIPKYAAEPQPADMLVCTDVLEHIEPHLLEEVLRHTARLTKTVALFVVGTRASDKAMKDRRNAHLIIEPMNWWLTQIERHWRVVESGDMSTPPMLRRWRRPITKPRGAFGMKARGGGRVVSPAGKEFAAICTPLR